ncbi:hypothetical protein DFJ58DRAFT_336726 [Suillus subalutaceus]|uniref:uncharacterized protein n=1 Tax=Suillus subalutaceus TaxID=48586 RepID=UPI001B879246|nr:uncharacterized protein DFJ58DRAFT_336726 [Suillus subalutaceus]KAG1856612.1 hypothetical protein DFJ58DRAFT_336726 [Suillus subalutaceus]
MSASTPQKSTALGNYSFAHDAPTPQSNQHNSGVSSQASPAMGSNECAFQMLGPNNYSSSASLQHIATTSDSDVHAVVHMHMMASPNIAPWASDSPSSRNAVSHGFPHNSPIPHDIGGAGSRTSGHPATGNVYMSSHASSLGPISHTSPMSSQCNMTVSDMHSVVPMMANPNVALWTPGNFGTTVLLSPSQSVLYPHDLEGVNSSFQHPPIQSEPPINQPSPLPRACRFKTALA